VSPDVDPVEWTRQAWSDGDLPSPDHFAAMASLLRTHQAMVTEIDRRLKPHGMSRTAFLLMATLLISRDHTRPLGQLSKQLMVHPTTVTLVIDQLENRGMVSRRPHPTDRRTVLAALTAVTFWCALYIGLTGKPFARLMRTIPTRYYVAPLLGFAVLAWGWKIFIHLRGIDGW
jgi:DNA-binding MarR family transcriptional regulator